MDFGIKFQFSRNGIESTKVSSKILSSSKTVRFINQNNIVTIPSKIGWSYYHICI